MGVFAAIRPAPARPGDAGIARKDVFDDKARPGALEKAPGRGLAEDGRIDEGRG